MPGADEADGPGREQRMRARLLFVFAALGALLPWALLVLVVGARDPLPPACRGSDAHALRPAGQIVYSIGSSLWTAHADLSAPVKLVGEALATEILAAALSPDRKSAAFLVATKGEGTGTIRVRLVGIGPGSTPNPATELWSDPHYPATGGGPAELSWLGTDKVLFGSSYVFPKPQTPPRLVGVVSLSTKPALLQAASESDFLGGAHGAWPETHNLRLRPPEPALDQRVTGAEDAAGTTDRTISSPFGRRVLHQLVVGRLGGASLKVECGGTDPVHPLLFSPDGTFLAVSQQGTTYLLDLAGGPPMTPLVDGRLLDWRS